MGKQADHKVSCIMAYSERDDGATLVTQALAFGARIDAKLKALEEREERMLEKEQELETLREDVDQKLKAFTNLFVRSSPKPKAQLMRKAMLKKPEAAMVKVALR